MDENACNHPDDETQHETCNLHDTPPIVSRHGQLNSWSYQGPSKSRMNARELYGRVFAVDIRFRDVGERTRALAKAK